MAVVETRDALAFDFVRFGDWLLFPELHQLLFRRRKRRRPGLRNEIRIDRCVLQAWRLWEMWPLHTISQQLQAVYEPTTFHAPTAIAPVRNETTGDYSISHSCNHRFHQNPDQRINSPRTSHKLSLSEGRFVVSRGPQTRAAVPQSHTGAFRALAVDVLTAASSVEDQGYETVFLLHVHRSKLLACGLAVSSKGN